MFLSVGLAYICECCRISSCFILLFREAFLDRETAELIFLRRELPRHVGYQLQNLLFGDAECLLGLLTVQIAVVSFYCLL